jgi:hypothetical protein
MRDLRIISAKALLRINTISPIRGFWPPSLFITGVELNKATEIEINETLVGEFIVKDASSLIAKIPESQVGRPITGIRAYTDVAVDLASAPIELALRGPVRSIKGIDRMVQAWMVVFLTTPGSDIFSKNSGGGARSLIGKITDAAHQSVAADLALCIDRTKNDLMRLQMSTPGIPLEERLMSAGLSAISFSPATSVLSATVSLTSMAGGAASLSLG